MENCWPLEDRKDYRRINQGNGLLITFTRSIAFLLLFL